MKTRILASLIFILATVFTSPAAPVRYIKLYDFGGVNAIPSSALTLGPCGTWFGTTYGGAAADGTGSVFAITESGHGVYAVSTLYRFNVSGSPSNDGQYPFSGMIRSADGATLIGTTQQGGSGGGAVFELDFLAAQQGNNNGAGYTVWHRFDSALEGGAPRATLAATPVVSSPAVYFGTSYSDGIGGGGSLYSYTYTEGSGVFQPLHSWFNPGGGGGLGVGGANPIGQLAVALKAPGKSITKQFPVAPRIVTNLDLSTLILYGVTRTGGSNNWGTIYRVDGNGSNYMVLHHFNSVPTNGTTPMGGLVLSGNVLYGTTTSGGASSGGTIFKINTDGNGFQILTNLSYSTTGSSPQGDLVLSGSTLYGTTYFGGPQGGGTVYSMSVGGTNFTVLHAFTSPAYDGAGGFTNIDGGWSVAGVVLDGDSLLGTTPYGGTNGVGTAYRIRLPEPPRLRLAPAGGNLQISWPSWASNYVLLQNPRLGTTNWTTNSLAVADNGTNRSVLVVPAKTNVFFRLFSPLGP